jgi:DNA-binding transcriptional ArsR family regulator
MTLTWTIGSDVEPDPASWADLAPAVKQHPENPPGPKPVMGALVLAALKAGYTTTKAIAEVTGLTQTKVGQALHSLRRNGFVVSYGSGKAATWGCA